MQILQFFFADLRPFKPPALAVVTFFSSKYVILQNIKKKNMCIHELTLGRTRKFIPPPWYKEGGGGWVDVIS